jgi:hypothetical protein
MTIMTITAAVITLYNRLLTGLIIMQIEGKIQAITDKLTTIGRPLAILAVVFGLLSYVAEPLLPDAARENKGVIRKVLFALLAIGIVPDLVTFIAG